MPLMVKSEEINDGVPEIYEVGYLVTSLLSDEKVGEMIEKTKVAIKKDGGEIISEESPKLRDLAYIMEKMIDHKKEVFNNAYFGWIKFDISKDKVEKINKLFNSNESVIRFLLIKTARENTMSSGRRSSGKGGVRSEKNPLMSDEDMEKTVAALVAE